MKIYLIIYMKNVEICLRHSVTIRKQVEIRCKKHLRLKGSELKAPVVGGFMDFGSRYSCS